MSSSPNTRIFARGEVSDSPSPKQQTFSVREPAGRTTLFPTRSPSEPAQTPTEPASEKNGPRARFSDGGTQILSAPVGSVPSADAKTQHFAVEQLLSRRAELEQELNRELEQELSLLAGAPGVPPLPQEAQQPIEASAPPRKPRKLVLRASMLGLLVSSVAMLAYKPPPGPAAPPPHATTLPAPRSASERAASKPIAPSPVLAVVPNPRTTLQRAAADVIAEGRYPEALVLYRQLAESEPTNKAYAEVVQILEHRVAAPTKPDSPN